MPVSVLDNFVEDPGTIPGSGSVPMSKMVQEPRPDLFKVIRIRNNPKRILRENREGERSEKNLLWLVIFNSFIFNESIIIFTVIIIMIDNNYQAFSIQDSTRVKE